MNIEIRGAKSHNLKNVSVDIPLNQFTVITGLSGSGKSSLAFDTLYAQSQRQYTAGLSPTLRTLFKRQGIPPVDTIVHLPPVVAVDQQPLRSSTRATVGTATEIYDFMRVLFARAGEVSCPRCGTRLQQQSEDSIVDQILSMESGTRFMLLAPVVFSTKGTQESVLEQLRKRGLTRVRVDGTVYELDSVPPLSARGEHTIEAVIDRCVVKAEARDRITDSVVTAVQFSSSAVIVNAPDSSGKWSDTVYSTRYSCPGCGGTLPEVAPRTFSLYSPYFQTVSQCVRVCSKTILEWTSQDVASLNEEVNQTLQFYKKTESASPAQKAIAEQLLERIQMRLAFLDKVGISYLTLNRTLDTLSGGEMQRVKLSRALGSALTGVCYVLDEPSVGLHHDDCARLLETIAQIRQAGNTVVAVEHDAQFIKAADWIIDVGPGAGEAGGEIVAVGNLEQIRQNPRSITGRFLKSESEIESPVKSSCVENDALKKESKLLLSGACLNNLQQVNLEIPLGKMTVVTGKSGSGKSSLIIGTLLPAVKWELSNKKQANPVQQYYKSIWGTENLQRVIWVDQAPIGKSPRSNPATFTGIYDDIRKLFASTKSAKQYGYSAARFAFNLKSGRCETCQGNGYERIELNLLPDIYVQCRACGGKQFNAQTLSIRYKDKSIAEVLSMSIQQSAEFFESIPSIAPTLRVLCELGLGYLRLGQGANTLSGGEAQRIKLAVELVKAESEFGAGKTLFVLDEPTTGLHPFDIKHLITILRRLTDRGNTVVVIEHNEQIQSAADFIIELGPGGGRFGGRIIL